MKNSCILLVAAVAAVNCYNQTEIEEDNGSCLKAFTSSMGITTSLNCRGFCYTKFLYPKCEGDNCTCVSTVLEKNINVHPSIISNSKPNINCHKEIKFDGEETANISCRSFCSARYLQAKCVGDFCKCTARENAKKYPTLPPLNTPKSSRSYYNSYPYSSLKNNLFLSKFEIPIVPSKSEYLKRYKGRYIVL